MDLLIENLTMSVIHQPHDKLFKLSLSNLKIARDFFTAHLPGALLDKIDFSTLKLEKQSFIDEAYKANEADVVHSVQLNGHTAYIYILCEQQTEIEHHMPFRLLLYTIRLMESHLRQYPDSSLPLVYPIVVYAGEKLWNAPLEIFPLFGEQEVLAREWLLKPYQLLDLQRISDEDLRKHIWSGLMAFALKNRQIQNFAQFLNKLLPWIHQLEMQDSVGVFLGKVVLQYLVNGMEANETDLFLQQTKHYLSKELQGEAMTLAECFKQQGFEKGIQKGMQQGMRQGQAAMILQQLEWRFGQIPAHYKQKIEQANDEILLQWGKTILESSTLDEVFQ